MPRRGRIQRSWRQRTGAASTDLTETFLPSYRAFDPPSQKVDAVANLHYARGRRLTATLSASGAVPLLAGLGVQALTTYLFLVIAGRAWAPVGFGALSGLYLLLTGTRPPDFSRPWSRRSPGSARTGGPPQAGTTLYRRAIRQGLVASALAVVVFFAPSRDAAHRR